MAENRTDRLSLDEESQRREGDRGVRDTGHTAGGGSLGHDQPPDVQRETPLRNVADDRGRATDRGRNATGSEADPVMPQDDATLKTKI
jgi:hypothetical protein